MIKVYLIYIFTFFVYELDFFPLNINDIFSLIFGPITLIMYFFNNKKFFNYYTLLFLNKDLKYIVYFGLFGIFFYFIFDDATLFYSFFKALRILYFFISLFTSIFIMNITFEFIEEKKENLFRLINIISYSSSLSLFLSIINSLAGNCKIQYGGNICFLNQTSYSSNGYISLSLFYINLVILFLINNFDISFKRLNLTKLFIFLNIISSTLIVVSSGSRGATFSLILTTVIFFSDSLINIIKLRINIIILLFALYLPFLINSNFIDRFRSLSFLFINSLEGILNSSARFNLNVFPLNKKLLGLGNFNISDSPFSTSYFDGTLRLFTISYGFLGLIFIIYLNYFFIKKLFKIRAKLLGINNSQSIKILYTTFFYLVFSSFPNENIIINGNSIIFVFSFIMPLMIIDYLSNKLFLTNASKKVGYLT